MLREYSHIKAESFAQIRALALLKYGSFFRGLFLLAHPGGRQVRIDKEHRTEFTATIRAKIMLS